MKWTEANPHWTETVKNAVRNPDLFDRDDFMDVPANAALIMMTKLADGCAVQEQLMREMEEQMAASIRAMEPNEMLKTWLPTSMKGLEHLRELFSQMTGAKRE